MKSISSLAFAVALVVGTAAVVSPVGEASAMQKKKKGDRAVQAPPRNITAAARPALIALEKVVRAKDIAAYPAALAAAEATATSPDDKYVLAKYRMEHGITANDTAEQMVALEGIIASGVATAEELPAVHQSIGILAFNSANWQKSHDAFTKTLELQPANNDARVNLALTKSKLKRPAEAVPLLEEAIAAAKATGQPAPESWYRNALLYAFEARMPQALSLSRDVLAAYPTQENWRNHLVVFKDTVRADDAASLDILRLMRASKAMNSRNEYYELAIQLSDGALPAEAKSVLEEAGRAALTPPARPTDDTYKRVMSSSESRLAEDRSSLSGLEAKAKTQATGRLAFRTADAMLGYGEYARAAALYRVAIAKGGADLDLGLANTHLGIALALAGNKPEAETAFRAVTGARANVAALWLAWLARPSAA